VPNFSHQVLTLVVGSTQLLSCTNFKIFQSIHSLMEQMVEWKSWYQQQLCKKV